MVIEVLGRLEATRTALKVNILGHQPTGTFSTFYFQFGEFLFAALLGIVGNNELMIRWSQRYNSSRAQRLMFGVPAQPAASFRSPAPPAFYANAVMHSVEAHGRMCA